MTAERRFHLAFTAAIAAAMAAGFTRTFFLKPLFPETQALAAPEPYFYVHGVVFTAWFVLLIAQATLISQRRVQWHRQAGWVGAGLAVVMLGMGIAASLLAAARPTGFVGVPLPPEQFLVVPLTDLALFALFVGLAVWRRRDLQAHKRFMLLASVALIEAAVTRWPIDGFGDASPVPWLLTYELATVAFLVPMVAWDLWSRGRLHPATVLGLVVIPATFMARLPLAGTAAWQTLGRAAIALVS